MRLLLDTNALLWTSDEKRVRSLGKEAYRLIQSSDLVYFSSLSIAEITIKTMLGKSNLSADATKAATTSGLLELPFTAKHAEALGGFQSLGRHDPFDRMLLAQASVEQLVLLTADKLLLQLGLNYVADARE